MLPRLAARSLTLSLLVATSGGCQVAVTPPSPPTQTQTPTPTPTTAAPLACARGRSFIIVRHAEKASTEKDTPLSERGRARARTIAAMLANAGVTRLVASQFKRTQETLAPLAQRGSLTVDVRSADKPAELVSELRGSPDGSVTVIASHSNVVPQLVRDLGAAKVRGASGDSLAEEDFSRVYVITLPCAGTPIVLELSSGE